VRERAVRSEGTSTSPAAGAAVRACAAVPAGPSLALVAAPTISATISAAAAAAIVTPSTQRVRSPSMSPHPLAFMLTRRATLDRRRHAPASAMRSKHHRVTSVKR
jgi:hypothetical protein